MRNIIGPPVVGDDLYGRDYELARLWGHLENLPDTAASC